MQTDYDNFFGGQVDFNLLLEQLNSEDIMFQFEGISNLANILAASEDRTLKQFPYEAISKKLVNLIKQPAIMDISNTIKGKHIFQIRVGVDYAITSLTQIMDIFPNHISFLVSLDLVSAIREVLENPPMECMELVEHCIKCCEPISQQHPREVLTKGILMPCFNIMDFFDQSTQRRILNILLYTCDVAETESEFTKNMLPAIQRVCEMLMNNYSESQQEKLTQILSKVAISFIHYPESIELTKLSALYTELANLGVYEVCLKTLKEVNFNKSPAVEGQQQINTTEQNKQVPDAVVINTLKILQHSCQNSQDIVELCTVSGLFEILNNLLPDNQNEEPRTNIVTEVIMVLSAILPTLQREKKEEQKVEPQISEEPKEEIKEESKPQVEEKPQEMEKEESKEEQTQDKKEDETEKNSEGSSQGLFGGEKDLPSEKDIQLAQKQILELQNQRQTQEQNRRDFFKTLPADFYNLCTTQILGRLFSAFNQQSDPSFRLRLVQVVQKLLTILPNIAGLSPEQCTKFIHQILSQQNVQQTLICLEVILVLLKSNSGKELASLFFRHGIQQSIKDLTLSESVQQMNSQSGFHPFGGGGARFELGTRDMIERFHMDRDRVNEFLHQIVRGLESDELDDEKKQKLTAEITKQKERIKVLDRKIQEFVLLEKKERENPLLEGGAQKIGDVIQKLALQILSELQNPNLQCSHSQPLFTTLEAQAKMIISLAQKVPIDILQTQKTLDELAITLSKNPLTNYEFVHSGLLSALSTFLAADPTKDTDEESKSDKPQQLSQEEAFDRLIRVRLFADAMTRQEGKDGELPFKRVFDLCQEQLTLEENLIFREPTNQELQDQGQLRGTIVNLIYDAKLPQTQQPQSKLQKLRHSLFTQLKEFPLPVRPDNLISHLSDFLLKRVRSQKEIEIMISQVKPRLMAMGHPTEKDEGLKPEYSELFERCLDRIQSFFEESQEEELFIELKDTVAKELEQYVREWEEENDGKKVVNSFYAYLSQETSSMIESVCREELDEMAHEDIPEEEKELIMQEMVLKTNAFVSLIQQVQKSVFDWPEWEKQEKWLQIQNLPSAFFQDIPLEKEEKASCHNCVLIKHEKGHHTHWSCDRVQGARLCRGNKHPGMTIEAWRCDPCDFDLCHVCMKIDRWFTQRKEEKATTIVAEESKEAKEQKEEPDLKVEDLQKEGLQDVTLQFYYNGKPLRNDQSLQDIIKEAPLEDKNVSPISKIFSPNGEFRQIYFTIVAKEEKKAEEPKEEAKDSEKQVEVKQRNTDCVTIVSQILKQFQIDGLMPKQIKDEDKKTKLAYQRLESALKLLSVLHFVTASIVKIQSDSLKILTTAQLPALKPDLDVLALSNKFQSFVHQKIDHSLQKLLGSPQRFGSHHTRINQTLRNIVQKCSWLFTFATKELYMRIFSFQRVDEDRAYRYLLNHLKKTNEREARHRIQDARKIESQKIEIDRDISIMEQSLEKYKKIEKRKVFDVVYKDEEGFGLGPTLEFYGLLGRELSSDKDMWMSDTLLFPKPMGQETEQVKQVEAKFELAGFFVARALLDDRLIDLPLHPIFWDMVLDKPMTLFSMKDIHEEIYTTAVGLMQVVREKESIDAQVSEQAERERLYEDKCKFKNARVEDCGLFFCNPLNNALPIQQNEPNDKEVTLHNLHDYVEGTVESCLNTQIKAQVQAFKRGFELVLPLTTVSLFDSKKEIETVVCGVECQGEEWTDLNHLQKIIKADHGYRKNSPPYLFFLTYMTELKPEQRSPFVQFLTGSPKLPQGGFAALEPPLTVVLRQAEKGKESTADNIMPSVATCQNYLKLPQYSSLAVLKLKFDLAIQDGNLGFTLA